MSPDRILDLLQLGDTQVLILCQFDLRFKPELGFTISVNHMNVHPLFFP
jgi:hypothetical protein